MKTIIECPLGAKCEYIGEDKNIYRCAWYTKLAGKNPQSEEIIDEWKCAMAWMPLMMVENAQTNRGQTKALESFRNKMVEGNGLFLDIVSNAAANQRLR